MKTPLALTLLAGAMLASTGSHAADAGNWLVRARAIYLDTANKSDAIPSLGVPADAIHVEKRWIPEVDISYFFTKNLAAELVLTYPQKHEVKVTNSVLGGFNAGSFKHLPPTLTLQYHFMPDSQFSPYVGAGVNYTRISGVSLSIPTVGSLELEKSSWGGAIGAGFDYKLSGNMTLNVDVKKVQIGSDVKLAGTKVSHVDIDPWLIGVGVGWKF